MSRAKRNHPAGIAVGARARMYHALAAHMRQEICASQFDDLIDEAWRSMLDQGLFDDSVDFCFFGLWYTYTDWDRRFLNPTPELWDAYRRCAAFLQTFLEYKPVTVKKKVFGFTFKKTIWNGFEPFNSEEEWLAHEHLVDHFSKTPPPIKKGKMKLVPGQIF